MSADLLQHGPEHERRVYDTADHMDPQTMRDGGCPGCENDALRVARAYLGRADA